MFTTVGTSLDTTTLSALLAQCERTGDDLATIIATAVADWLARQADPNQPDACPALQRGPERCCGYQWKSLFLPEGTLLRSWSHGDCRDAKVIGGRIMHGGTAVSPNQFARSFARTVRNAWRDLLVRRPGDTMFYTASRLRRELAAQAAAADKKADKKAGTKASAKAAKTAPSKAHKKQSRKSQIVAANKAAPVPQPAAADPARDPTPGPGWNLPERRKMRFRLEDVAFD
jgi:hypothetical protein